MIDLKSRADIERIREGGRMLSEIAARIRKEVAPGRSTMDLDLMARKLFREKKMKPSFLYYGRPPFPAVICTSINDEIVHGIPSEKRILTEGDIISIDLGGKWRGFHTDMAFTVGVGEIRNASKRLIQTTRKALETGITKMYTRYKLHDFSHEVQSIAEKEGFNVVRELVGHGIGRQLHEPPNVPNFGRPGTGLQLKEGMVLALEPMLNEGTYKIKTKEDSWTVGTKDGRLSAHFELTVAVTDNGPELMTEFHEQ